MTRPITVDVDFTLSKPKSKPKWKLYPDVKPDLDKLVRAVFDSLSGIIWKDDSLVCELSASKIYGDNPGADIYISEIREAR